ncbi:MAG: HipA domain-containing protein [Adlercreutzia sp.]
MRNRKWVCTWIGIRVSFAVFSTAGTAISTHIVKAANRQFERLSENEYYCLRLAGSGTFRARVLPRHLWDRRSSSLKRFDRMVLPEDDRRAGGGVQRVQQLHQEDFARCSAFCRSASTKGACAMRRGGTSLRVLFDPVRDIEMFVRLLVVNAVLGNCDGHQEPHRASGRRLVVVCIGACVRHRSTVVYGNLSTVVAMASGRPTRSTRLADDFLGELTFRRAW